jgi:uncharacterized protein
MNSFLKEITRRSFLRATSLGAVAAAGSQFWMQDLLAGSVLPEPLSEFEYSDVSLSSEIHEKQLHDTCAVLMELSEDSLLKPLRAMAGLPAPGAEMGGWYLYDPDYDKHKGDLGFAPGCPFGQWVSGLARMYAITGSQPYREKVMRLNRLYAETISADFYIRNRFPAYCYDKLVCGLIDSHKYAKDPDAYAILEHTTDTALPHLPPKAIEHDHSWRPGTDETYTWDESYTMPENLYLAYQRGAGKRYRELGTQYLLDEYFGPLAEGRNILAGSHAYSHVNALSSAMQAYFTVGSERHFRAAKNGFDVLSAQSYATGGWGPDEQLRAPGSGDVAASLTKSHASFETPCGSYAHFKITRYLLRATHESRYGDSMERVMYNTILGAKPLEADGTAFYYSDYNFEGHKVYSWNHWPCCSGTLPQVAADYRINTYLRDAHGVYVNLYIPSTLRWVQGGAQISLGQESSYPFEPLIAFDVTAARPSEFALNFRIPSWAKGASISVNGKQPAAPIVPGSFASVRREWRTGDRIEVNLPPAMRLEAIDEQHPDTVALLSGPLVLFAITKDPSVAKRSELLAARKIGPREWQAETASGPMKMISFPDIRDERYTTYLKVS